MKQPRINAGLYMRLSRDDESYGDSVSIETQRSLLQQFVNENGFIIVDEYVDDGYSGTNFNRPRFRDMLEDAESGKINCIITKDLSRFGREHIESDYYLEHYFPQNNIRYIAVTDGEDSEKGLSDFVPFKNLFNEWYAKDTSRKIKNAMSSKFKAGERTFAYAPVGYIKHPDIKNKLAIDEEYRWIIERIFLLALEGNGAGKITKILISEKVPTPGYLNYLRYGTFAHIYKDCSEAKKYAWTIAQIKSILKDETYIGNTIHYKQTNISYKNKKKIRQDEEKWLRIENTHEAIISKDDFDSVQKMIASRRRECKSTDNQIFAGLIKCADCGWSLGYSYNSTCKHPYHYYKCSRYSSMGKQYCSSHFIKYDVIYAFVLSRIQFWYKQVNLDEKEVLSKLLNTVNSQSNSQKKKLENELKKKEKRQREIDLLYQRLFEDHALEKITDYNFDMLSKKYQNEQTQLIDDIDALKTELADINQTEIDASAWINAIKECQYPTELTAPLLNSLIDKIVVYDAVKTDDGPKEQKIDIYYKFIGNIE